jgi:hypothetical protein
VTAAIDLVNEMIKDRGKDYGNPYEGGAALGKIWAGILSDHLQTDIPDLPPHVVYLMMTGVKLSRAARPFTHKQDNYIDGIAYIHLAEETSRAP